MAELFLVERPAALADVAGRTPDWRQRRAALDVRQSVIVEAPAGSGKTGLLIQRLLKLLADASVAEPEQVMAITFTVKATAELRDRVLTQLDAAARELPLADEFERETRLLAEAVLERDAALGWGLRERPERLRIRTIDSVCAEIARALPVLSGAGGHVRPLLDASPLHTEAARRTLMQLGGGDPVLTEAIRTVLLHRDGNLGECERLLAEMLQWREQWGGLVPLGSEDLTDDALDGTVLPRLNAALDRAICGGLQQLAGSIPFDVLEALTFLASEMGHAEGYKGQTSPIALCAALERAPGETADHLGHWRALIHLLTTPEGDWRKGFRSNWLLVSLEKRHAERLKAIVQQLAHRDDLLQAFNHVRCLPPARFPEEQWVVAKALFRLLRRALVELQLVFAERGACDFPELGLLARTAMRRDEYGDDLAAALGMRLQHLLVDEMQDTSSSQYELIERLTQGWDGESQTVFLVGDPKQSIYLFRQARVERFLRVMQTGRLGELRLNALRLTANFRSQRDLVDQLNTDFGRVFPADATPDRPHTKFEDVQFARSEATRPATAAAAGRVWHAHALPQGAAEAEGRSPARRQARANAAAVRRIATEWQARPLPAGRTRPWSVAVLVRSRSHLAEIVAALKEEPDPVPFRAVDIEPLNDRPEVLDLFALTRALLHPADRVAWLAILRAPWCGLTLADLHLLAGGDDPAHAQTAVEDLIPQRGELLSPDGARRLEHVWTVMREAVALRGRLTAAQWVERTWRALGGPLWLGVEPLANATRFLQLLDELEAGAEPQAGTINLGLLEMRLKRLYAEAGVSPGAVELTTIHNAKGLEWDVVIVPALERQAQTTRGRLLTWTELDGSGHGDDPRGAAHFALAPIAGRGEESRELNDWLRSIEDAREAAERKRLFYVACTRAREELHLFASPETSKRGTVSLRADSLLKAAWPAAEAHFVASPTASNILPMRGLRGAEGFPVETIAAVAEEQAVGDPQSEQPPQLHRLPTGFNVAEHLAEGTPVGVSRAEMGTSLQRASVRPDGSFAARALGNAVHAFLDLLSQRIAKGETPDALLATLPQWIPRVAAVLRSSGLPPAMVERLGDRVQAALAQTLDDPIGRWLLSAHPDAASERALTVWDDSRLATIRMDRLFRAGPRPLEPGVETLWIVDFKTATHGREGLDAFLEKEREKYTPQIESYARALASEAGPGGLCTMLYYPLLPANIAWRPLGLR